MEQRNSWRTLVICCYLGSILVALAFEPVLGSRVSEQDTLAVRLLFEKSGYIYGEEIVAEILLINLTADTLGVVPTSAFKVFSVTGYKDQPLTDIGLTVDRFPNISIPSKPLAPGDTLREYRRLCEYYGLRSTTSFDTSCFRIGRQVVRVSYWGNAGVGSAAINVVEPIGREREAFEELCRIYPEYRNRHTRSNCAQRLRNFIDQYNSSAYVPMAMRSLLRIYVKDKADSDVLELSKNMVDRFPNRYYAELGLDHILFRQSESENVELLQRIIRDKPRTVVARYALSKLEKLLGGQK